MVRGLQVLVFGALLAVLLTIVMWMLPERQDPGTRPPSAPAGAAPAANAMANGIVAQEPARRADAEPQRVEVPGVDAAAAAEPGPSVQVRVLGPDGKALAGVTVRYYGAFAAAAGAKLDAAARLEFERLQNDREAQLLRFGTAVLSDANGIARWPWVAADRTSWSVCARHGDDWGEDWINANAAATQVHDLQLWPDQSFAVRVLDAQQQPAEGVGIEAVYLQDADAVQSAPRLQTHALAATDATGVARLAHVQTWARSIVARGNARPATIRPSLPGVDFGQEIDTALPPHEPVELHLPPTGSIQISLRDAVGAAVSGHRITMVEEPRPAEPRFFNASTDDRGVAMYARVGLARQWRLYVTIGSSSLQKVIDGPKGAGEIVKVEIAPDPAPRLRGQLLADGKAAAGVAVSVTADGYPLSGDVVHTDADGRFAVGATYGKWLGRAITTLQCRTVDDRGSPDGRAATWRGELTLTAGEHDVGILELREQPVVAAGKLQTSSGAIAAGLGIWVQAATSDADRPWQSVRLDLQMQPDGSFVFFGDAPAAALRLRIDSRCEYLPVAPVPFVAGARDLLVPLARGGSVKASVVVGTMLAGWNLIPELRPMTAAAAAAGIIRFERGSDPSVPIKQDLLREDPVEVGYTWPAVVPGRYRLLVRTRGVTVPLVEIDDVVVTDGECNSDDRLQHLQVRGLKAIVLQLPQAKSLLAARELRGEAMGAGVVFVLDGDTPTDQCVQVDGTVRLSATRPLDLLVRLHGCRDKVLRSVFEDQTVTLDPGIAVTVEATAVEVPAGAKLQCTLTPLYDALTAAHSWLYSAAAGGSLANPIYRSPAVDAAFADGRAQFAVNAPGRYRCSAQLTGADGVPRSVAVAPAELTIGENGGSFAVQIELTK